MSINSRSTTMGLRGEKVIAEISDSAYFGKFSTEKRVTPKLAYSPNWQRLVCDLDTQEKKHVKKETMNTGSKLKSLNLEKYEYVFYGYPVAD